MIQLLPNDVDAAVDELRWASEHNVIGGVMLPAVPPNHPVEPYYHERYDPLGVPQSNAVCRSINTRVRAVPTPFAIYRCTDR